MAVYSIRGNDSICEEILETVFDTGGRITLETRFDGTYTRIGGKRFSYNAAGKLISTSLLEGFVYKETDTIHYDEKGNVSYEEKYVTENHIPTRRLRTWFHQGKPVKKQEDDLLRGHTTWLDSFFWNPDHTRLDKKGYNAEGKISFFSKTMYDPRGNELDYERMDPDKKSTKHAIHSYDNKGRLIRYQETDGAGKNITDERYSLNEDGKKIRLDCYTEPAGKPSRTYLYTYTENGDLSSVIRMGAEGLLNRKTLYTYTYY